MASGRPFISFQDLHQAAKKRLPRILFDAIESGVEDELGLYRNTEAFGKYVLYPRQMQDVQVRSQKTAIFGMTYSTAIGIAPTGLAGMYRTGAETMMAKAAVSCDVPYILSGAGIEQMERVVAVAPERIWFQMYAANDVKISFDMMRRAELAGVRTLVLTVDTPVLPKRERDMRNGFGFPPRLSAALLLEALTHPAWIAEYFRSGGLPIMKTWAKYLKDGASAAEVFSFFRQQSPSVQTWNDLGLLRKIWKGNLVVKGLQHPDDARLAVECGVDGIIVSNHGGKAMDRGPAAIDVLPSIASAVGHQVTVMMDSGVRRGSDVVVARCLGAQFVFCGRAPLYGVIANGTEGVASAIEILRDEVDRTLGLIGCADIAKLSSYFLNNYSLNWPSYPSQANPFQTVPSAGFNAPPAFETNTSFSGEPNGKYPNIYAD